MLNHFNYILFRTPLQSLGKRFEYDKKSILPGFEEGLYLASPVFWKQFEKWASLSGKEALKMKSSFAKYWMRSCTRCTPYGTFAGNLLARVDDSPTAIILESSHQHIRKVRLDMNFVTELIKALMQIPVVKYQVLLYPNNTLYAVSDQWRYAEYSIKNNTREYHLTSIGNTPYIQTILKKADKGATIEDLANLIVQSEKVDFADAEAFIMEMWASQVLVPDLEPCVTGCEPLDHLILQLESYNDVQEIQSRLKSIQALIHEPKEGVPYYQKIEGKLKELSQFIENKINKDNASSIKDEPKVKIPKNTIQVDLFLSANEKHINKATLETCLNQVNDLFFLARNYENSELTKFRNNFTARYEDAEVPLAIALDSDLGIGYAGVYDENTGGGEFIDGLPIAVNGSNSDQPFDYLKKYALEKYNDYLQNNKTHIELTEKELKEFRKNVETLRFPHSLKLMGCFLHQNGKPDADNFLLDLYAITGPSSGDLLGRFTHGDKQLETFMKDILVIEEQKNPEAIYAEIAHLPQARIGNVILRPVLRKYEIPYSGKSGAMLNKQIPVNDLMVSVRGEQIQLRSKKHNRRVIPRLSSAHNFSYKTLPAYKFLCDLQMQGLAWPGVWDWGNLNSFNHLPRVVYKNLIIQKETWKINEKDINDLPKDKKDHPAYFTAFREKHKLPQCVVYKESDNKLLIDFTQNRCIALLLNYLKRNKNIELEEFLFTEENCLVRDSKGRPYTNEVIIPLTYRKDKSAKNQGENNSPVKEESQFPPVLLSSQLEALPQRRFSITSEWLYFKVYVGAKTAEKVLAKVVLPFVDDGITSQLFSRFFFIKYRDENGSHLRIRFYNRDTTKQLEVQRKFMEKLQPLIDDGTLKNVTLDSYNRELERYHPLLINEAEELFYNDSLAALRLVDLFGQIENENQYRMLFAMRGIKILLDDFGCDMSDKLKLLKRIQSGYFQEFGNSKYLQKELNDRYRKHKTLIESHMDPKKDQENEIDEAVEFLTIRSEMNKPVIHKMFEKITNEEKEPLLAWLLPSYLHMFMNRLFISQQRKYELVVYTFLERYYTSRVALAKILEKSTFGNT